MADKVVEFIFGADVSKGELVIADWASGQLISLENQLKTIEAWLSQFTSPIKLALEPTSSYHLALAHAAVDRGHVVYLINPRQIVHYREAVGERNKTDPADALLLARYLAREGCSLKPYKPRSSEAQELWALLKRRSVIVDARKSVTQSFKEVNMSIEALKTQFSTVLKRIDRRMSELIQRLGWSDDYQRCQTIPGIGPLNATALVLVYHRGAFSGLNAFISYLGLDVRLRESGKVKGKRKLTKRGPSEIRRLLYCAAKPSRTHKRFADYHQQQLDKGLSKTAANCILARKLARVAFALMSSQQTFKY